MVQKQCCIPYNVFAFDLWHHRWDGVKFHFHSLALVWTFHFIHFKFQFQFVFLKWNLPLVGLSWPSLCIQSWCTLCWHRSEILYRVGTTAADCPRLRCWPLWLWSRCWTLCPEMPSDLINYYVHYYVLVILLRRNKMGRFEGECNWWNPWSKSWFA